MYPNVTSSHYLQTLAAVRLSVYHVHQVVVLFLRLTIAAGPVVTRTPPLLQSTINERQRTNRIE